MSVINDVYGREIIDSRGNPTIEVEVVLSSGVVGRASVPSGASTGTREATELRDTDSKRYGGKGVLEAIHGIADEIKPMLKGKDPQAQQQIDEMLIEIDGTVSKGRLGANAILGVSLAVAEAAANDFQMPLYAYLGGDGPFSMPVPMINILNGGAHADNNLDLQEFMILPVGANCFSEALRYGVEVFHALKKILLEKKLSVAVGDEGGFAPNLVSNEQAITLILEAIELAEYKPGEDVALGLDVASSEFYKEGVYHLASENKKLSSQEFTSYLTELCDKYPILSIEDGMAEDDWEGWKLLSNALGKRIQLVGDDLFVTNAEILKKGVRENIANSILIKPNQIGTLTETLKTMGVAKQAGYSMVISHRSGETESTFIADLAVATAAGQIKTGSACRTDRVAKYNQLLRIECALGTQKAPYLGKKVFDHIQEKQSQQIEPEESILPPVEETSKPSLPQDEVAE